MNRSRLQKISEVENPEIGKFYLVPTCFIESAPGLLFFWPVIGSWHEDAELDFQHWHFHYDWRFIPERLCNMAKVHVNNLEGKRRSPDEPLVVWKRRKMLRVMPEFPGPQLSRFAQMEQNFFGVKMKCMTCPHKGMPLQGMPVDKHGVVTCPGHGLKWFVNSGELYPQCYLPYP